MDTKFDKLFDKIVMESKQFSKKHSIIKEDENITTDPNTDIETEARKKAPPQLSEEQKRANFNAIVEKVKAAFNEQGVDCSESEDEDEDGVTINAEWRWVNKNGGDDYLGLSYCNGEATEDNNGGTGDIDLTDVEGTAKYLIDEYLFNPEYGGIGLEDRTLEECVPEFLQQMSEDSNYSDLDWDNMDLDELADEFIDEYYEYEFETEDEIKDQLQEWLYERFGDDEEQED